MCAFAAYADAEDVLSADAWNCSGVTKAACWLAEDTGVRCWVGYAREWAGSLDSTKERRESQSKLVHPSRFSVVSLGQIHVEVPAGVEMLCWTAVS